MEGHSTLSSDSGNATVRVGTDGSGGGASSFLANLPSRGLFTSTILSSNPGGMRVYICEHDTSPPEDQLVKTDQENILIRSLTLKNQRGDGSSKDGKGIAVGQSSRKRGAERAVDTRAKRAITSAQAVSQQEGSKQRMPQRDLQNLTVERIRALLREKGLSQRGRKDELIARLKGATTE